MTTDTWLDRIINEFKDNSDLEKKIKKGFEIYKSLPSYNNIVRNVEYHHLMKMKNDYVYEQIKNI